MNWLRATPLDDDLLARADRWARAPTANAAGDALAGLDEPNRRVLLGLRVLAEAGLPPPGFADALERRLAAEAARLRSAPGRRPPWRRPAAWAVLAAGLVAAVLLGLTPAGGAVAQAIGLHGVVVGRPPGAPGGRPVPRFEVVPTPVPPDLLAARTGFPVRQPTGLPAGAALVGASVEEPPSDGAVARLDYRLPRADGSGQDVLTVRQSRPARGLQVFIDPARVVSRADVAGREAVVYRPDGPPSGRGFLILAWTDGERHVELWGTLPAARLVEIARALAP